MMVIRAQWQCYAGARDHCDWRNVSVKESDNENDNDKSTMQGPWITVMGAMCLSRSLLRSLIMKMIMIRAQCRGRGSL